MCGSRRLDGQLQPTVESVVERYPVADMRDGESFISNDPFKAGNSHVPDIVVITPVFYRGELIAFSLPQ